MSLVDHLRHWNTALANDAADEIESLRAQLATARGLLREASDGRVLDWVDWVKRAKREVVE